MTASEIRPEPWPTWAKVVVALLAILVVASVAPSIAMAASCTTMMSGMQMPMVPMTR